MRRAELEANIVPAAYWRVLSVEPLATHRLKVRFVDGTAGHVDMGELVASPEAGVFKALRDPDIFAGVYLAYGAVTWPGDIDLAPDAMHDEIKAHGKWVLR